MLLSHARVNGSLPIPCMSCLSHRCSVSLLNKGSLSLSLSLSPLGRERAAGQSAATMTRKNNYYFCDTFCDWKFWHVPNTFYGNEVRNGGQAAGASVRRMPMHMKLAALAAMAGSAAAFSPMMMSMDMDRRGPLVWAQCTYFHVACSASASAQPSP